MKIFLIIYGIGFLITFIILEIQSREIVDEFNEITIIPTTQINHLKIAFSSLVFPVIWLATLIQIIISLRQGRKSKKDK